MATTRTGRSYSAKKTYTKRDKKCTSGKRYIRGNRCTENKSKRRARVAGYTNYRRTARAQRNIGV